MKLFKNESIYIKGIAEKDPVNIYYSYEYTKIPDICKQPIEQFKWNSFEIRYKFKELKALPSYFLYPLPSKPVDPSQIGGKLYYPPFRKGKKEEKFELFLDLKDFEYVTEKGESKVGVNIDVLIEHLNNQKVKDNWEITIEFVYPEFGN